MSNIVVAIPLGGMLLELPIQTIERRDPPIGIANDGFQFRKSRIDLGADFASKLLQLDQQRLQITTKPLLFRDGRCGLALR